MAYRMARLEQLLQADGSVRAEAILDVLSRIALGIEERLLINDLGGCASSLECALATIGEPEDEDSSLTPRIDPG